MVVERLRSVRKTMKLTQDEQKLIRQAQASVKDKWRPLTIAAMFGSMLLYICFSFAYKVLQRAESFESYRCQVNSISLSWLYS